MPNRNLIFEQRQHYLLVTSNSVQTDFTSVVEATVQINEMVGQSPTPYALLDFRKVKFNLPKTNAFDLIRIYESRMANYKNITMAVVVRKDDQEIADLWTEFSQKRGFQFMAFTTIRDGETWLLRQHGTI